MSSGPLAVLAMVMVLFASSPARAVGEEEWQVSARAGAAMARVDGRHPWGPALSLELERGVTDLWAVRGIVGASLHPVSSEPAQGLPGGTVGTVQAGAGVTYSMDVLRLVPFIQVGVAVLHQLGAVNDGGPRLGIDAGLGATYLLNRHWGLGVVADYQFLPLDLSGTDPVSATPFQLTLAARISWLK